MIMTQKRINDIKAIEELIFRDDLDIAIREIQRLTNGINGDFNKDLVLINGRLSKLERQNRAGIISYDEYNVRKNRITHSLVDILSHLKRSDSGILDATHNSIAGSARKRILAAIIIAVLSLLIYSSFQFFSSSDTNSPQADTIQVDTMPIQADSSTINTPK